MRTNGLKQPAQHSSRNKLMAMVHVAAQHLDIEHGSDEYRAWLEKHTGKRSCKALSDRQLIALVDTLRQQGALDAKPPTGSADNRPTRQQWRKVETMARKLGYGDVRAAHFAAFVKHCTGLDNPAFLTRDTISSVIVGLEKVQAWQLKHKGQGATPGQSGMPHAPS